MLHITFIWTYSSTNVNEYNHIKVIACYLAPSKLFSVTQMVQNCTWINFLSYFYFWLMKKSQNTGAYLYLLRIVLYQIIIIMICFWLYQFTYWFICFRVDTSSRSQFHQLFCVWLKRHFVSSTNIMLNSFRVSYA